MSLVAIPRREISVKSCEGEVNVHSNSSFKDFWDVSAHIADIPANLHCPQ
jgi:hypothetical protein